MSTKFVMIYVDSDNNVVRVGLYEVLNNPKWLKWLSKRVTRNL